MAPALRVAAAAAALTAAGAQGTPTTVTVNWAQVVRPLKTSPGFQTVVNPLTTRESPVHDAVYGSIASLGASYQRYVPWVPYPKLGIAELEPPSTGNAVCGFVNSGGPGNPWTTTIDCASRGGGTIAAVTFADYGGPTGFCGALVSNASCTSPTAKAAVAAACVGRPSCTLTSNDETFGPAPCGAAHAVLAVQVACATPVPVATYWDFRLLDEGMADFLAAAGNRSQIPNFSTIPNWLFAGTPRVLYPDDPLGEIWNYESGTALADPTLKALGDYYGRLVAHYVEGGFIDEAGVFIPGYTYNIDIWEVLNEVEGEHHMTPQTYTAVYDAIVAGIRRWAPKGSANMKFMGLALEGSGNINYVDYFLNASNHAAGTPIDFISFHHYASATRDGGVNGTAYEAFFSSADTFMGQLAAIIAARDKLNPTVMLDADEVGVILSDDNDPKWTSSNPGFDNYYWNAAAASYAYIYGTSSVLGLDVLGESQLVGYPSLPINRGPPFNGPWIAPPQYPSVAMLNWTDGSPTARYTLLKLLVDAMKPGAPSGPYPADEADVLVTTTSKPTAAAAAASDASAPAAPVYAQAYVEGAGAGQRKVLIVSKSHLAQTVTLAGATGGTWTYVDETGGFSPAAQSVVLTSDTWTLARFSAGILFMPSSSGTV